MGLSLLARFLCRLSRNVPQISLIVVRGAQRLIEFELCRLAGSVLDRALAFVVRGLRIRAVHGDLLAEIFQ